MKEEREGLPREAVLANVPPGWRELAGRAWDLVTESGGRVVYVKEKWGSLAVSYVLRGDRERKAQVREALDELEEMSERTCKLCGAETRSRTNVCVEALCTSCQEEVNRQAEQTMERMYQETLGILREPDTARWGAHWDPERDRQDDIDDGEEQEPWQ